MNLIPEADIKIRSSTTRTEIPDIKLAFFDIDGTLLGLDGRYSETTANEIQRIQSLGVKTAVASGRPYFAARHLIEDLGLDAAGMFYTGAQLLDPKSATKLCSHVLADDIASQLLQEAKDLGLHCEAYTESAFFVEQHSDIVNIHAHHLQVEPQILPFSDVIGDNPLFKLLLGVNVTEQGDLLAVLALRYPQLIFAKAYLAAYPDWHFASVISGSASKQKAFQHLLNFHQVSADQVISFGDAESDMDFITMAGTGVAMGNANNQVKAVANIVAEPVWNDGVAKVLRQLIP